MELEEHPAIRDVRIAMYCTVAFAAIGTVTCWALFGLWGILLSPVFVVIVFPVSLAVLATRFQRRMMAADSRLVVTTGSLEPEGQAEVERFALHGFEPRPPVVQVDSDDVLLAGPHVFLDHPSRPAAAWVSPAMLVIGSDLDDGRTLLTISVVPIGDHPSQIVQSIRDATPDELIRHHWTGVEALAGQGIGLATDGHDPEAFYLAGLEIEREILRPLGTVGRLRAMFIRGSPSGPIAGTTGPVEA